MPHAAAVPDDEKIVANHGATPPPLPTSSASSPSTLLRAQWLFDPYYATIVHAPTLSHTKKHLMKRTDEEVPRRRAMRPP